MAKDRYWAEADAIMAEAEQAYEQADELISKYRPDLYKEKRGEAVRTIQEAVQPKLMALKRRIDQDAEAIERELEAFRFPLNVVPPNETVEQRTAREALKLQAVQTAYTLPMYNGEAFEALLGQGLNQAAFLYADRNDKAEASTQAGPLREAWTLKRDKALSKNQKYVDLYQRHREVQRGRGRIDRLQPIVTQGAFNAKIMDADRWIDRNL